MYHPIRVIVDLVDIPVPVDEGVLAASISFSVNLFRPYARRPTEVLSTIVSTSSASENPSVTDIPTDQVSTSLPSPSPSPVCQDDITTDDKMDGSMIVVKNTTTVDEEIVKRRWYCEEMRQSPVYHPVKIQVNDRNAMALGLLRRVEEIVTQTLVLPMFHWNGVYPLFQMTMSSSNLYKIDLSMLLMKVETNLPSSFQWTRRTISLLSRLRSILSNPHLNRWQIQNVLSTHQMSFMKPLSLNSSLSVVKSSVHKILRNKTSLPLTSPALVCRKL